MRGTGGWKPALERMLNFSHENLLSPFKVRLAIFLRNPLRSYVGLCVPCGEKKKKNSKRRMDSSPIRQEWPHPRPDLCSTCCGDQKTIARRPLDLYAESPRSWRGTLIDGRRDFNSRTFVVTDVARMWEAGIAPACASLCPRRRTSHTGQYHLAGISVWGLMFFAGPSKLDQPLLAVSGCRVKS